MHKALVLIGYGVVAALLAAPPVLLILANHSDCTTAQTHVCEADNAFTPAMLRLWLFPLLGAGILAGIIFRLQNRPNPNQIKSASKW